MPMIISKEGIAITERFFTAVALLVKSGRIKGLKTITTKFGLERRNILKAKAHPECTVVKPELLALLVREYGVSAEWLLMGEGPVFKDEGRITCSPSKT